jgi:O-antigen ligase
MLFILDEIAAQAVSSRDLSDIGTLNGRTEIWKNVLQGLKENPRIIALGTGPAVASEVMSPYFPEDSPIGIFHNSLLGVLVSFGALGCC